MEIEVRPLRSSDDRGSFRSGNLDLDRFFHRFAGQNQFRHHVGTTYVALVEDEIVGYATVSPGHVSVEGLPVTRRRRLPHYPLPILRLARLAVAEKARRAGVGKALLRAVFLLAHEMADRFGCVGVIVDAKPEAVEYYRRYGFEPLEVLQGALGDRPQPLSMFLPLAEVPR